MLVSLLVTLYLKSTWCVLQISSNAPNKMRVSTVASHGQTLQQLQRRGTEDTGQRAHFMHLRVLTMR